MNCKTTSKRVLSIAGKTLKDSNSPREKTLAGSCLSQAKPHVIGVRPKSCRLGVEILNRSTLNRLLKKLNKKLL